MRLGDIIASLGLELIPERAAQVLFVNRPAKPVPSTGDLQAPHDGPKVSKAILLSCSIPCYIYLPSDPDSRKASA